MSHNLSFSDEKELILSKINSLTHSNSPQAGKKSIEKPILFGAFSRKALKQVGIDPSKGMKKKGEINRKIDERLSKKAIEDGIIKFTKNREIDKRIKAIRDGDIVFDSNGDIDPKSKLVKSGAIVFQTTNACHIQSFEITDAVFKKEKINLTKNECEMVIKGINKDDNLTIKSYLGNLNGTKSMKNKGDHALDKEIINSIDSKTKLNLKTTERAHRIIHIVLNSKNQYPIKVIEAFRNVFSDLIDNNGNQICRKNAKIEGVDEGKAEEVNL